MRIARHGHPRRNPYAGPPAPPRRNRRLLHIRHPGSAPLRHCVTCPRLPRPSRRRPALLNQTGNAPLSKYTRITSCFLTKPTQPSSRGLLKYADKNLSGHKSIRIHNTPAPRHTGHAQRHSATRSAGVPTSSVHRAKSPYKFPSSLLSGKKRTRTCHRP